MADFLIDQQKLGLSAYCRRCLDYWRERYGDQVADRVETILRAHYKGKKNDLSRN